MEPAAHNFLKAALYKTFSTLMMATMALFMRMLGPDIPTGEAVFVRGVFIGGTVIAVLLLRGGFPSALRTRRLSGHLVRASISVIGMFALFGALARLPVVEVTAITFIAPLMTVILAALLLHERVRYYRWGAVIIGLVGGLVILVPRLGSFGFDGVVDQAVLGVLMAMTCMFGIAASTIQVRTLIATETTSAVTFYAAVAITLTGLASLPFGWIWPNSADLVALLGAGLSGAFGQIFFTESIRHAPASYIAPFEYLTLIWAFILGYAVLGEVPTSNVVIGAVIVALAGLFLIWRERQLGIRRRVPEPPAVD